MAVVGVVVVVCSAIIAYVLHTRVVNVTHAPPTIAINGYFGPGQVHDDSPAIEPFKIVVPDDELADLRERLERTRFYEPLEGAKFNYGFNTKYLREVYRYWMDKYDWRKQEALINQFDHYRTEIEGMKVSGRVMSTVNCRCISSTPAHQRPRSTGPLCRSSSCTGGLEVSTNSCAFCQC